MLRCTDSEQSEIICCFRGWTMRASRAVPMPRCVCCIQFMQHTRGIGLAGSLGPTTDRANNFRLLRICTAQHRSDSLQCDFICYFTGQTGDYLPFPTHRDSRRVGRRVEELLQPIGVLWE